MKFLFVGGGRRNQLTLLMKERGVDVDAYELDVNCPISLYCNSIIPGRKWNDEKIVEDIKSLSTQYDLILPLQDEASEIISKLNLSNACVSSHETTEICLNKKKFEQYFESNSTLCKYYPSSDNGNVILKPSFGHSSIGIFYDFQGKTPLEVPEDYIVQKRIFGTEYSIDCFYDLNSELIDFVPRERLKIVGGEVVESATTNKDKFTNFVNDISNNFKFKGPVCIQLIEDFSGNLWVIEINARMGGGCTLSIASGFDIIELLVQVFCKQNFSKDSYLSNWKQNYHLKRFFMDYCYEENSI